MVQGNKLKRSFDIVKEALDNDTFPCAAVLVRQKGSVGTELSSRFFGSPFPGGSALKENALFDLASLTKSLATTPLILRAFESGALKLQDPLSKYLPKAGAGQFGATIEDLLTHRASLPPVPALQLLFSDPESIERTDAIDRLLAVPAKNLAGQEVVYSCTGFLLLGLVLEHISGMRLGRLFNREIAEPLGLSPHPKSADSDSSPIATYNPSAELQLSSVPTEYCSWRKRRMHGQVHDESSYALGGDGGNAGLFATLSAVDRLFSIYENGAGLLTEETVKNARSLHTAGFNLHRGLGLQVHDTETCDGPLWPSDSFGHTGFTGTSAWCSPSLGLTSIILTNRVYYGRDATLTKIQTFRRSFHTSLLE
ncbi:serine hydrolase domain-containing protein [Treponema sp.]